MLARMANETYEPRGQAVFANSPRAQETAVVVAAKSGDGQAFEALVTRYQRRLLALATRFTGIREDAEDIVQESLRKAFIHLHKFEEKSSFSTWLTRIVINEGLMLLRRRRGFREISIDDSNGSEEQGLELEIPDSAPGPEISYLRRERQQIVSRALKQLNPGTQKAIELRDLGELSTEETAQVLGLSVGAVKARVFHGRRKLRRRLKHYFESTFQRRNHIARGNRLRPEKSLPPNVEPATRVINLLTRI
jgi:RNA polymerase sigma-70 factor, ECF subfamily